MGGYGGGYEDYEDRSVEILDPLEDIEAVEGEVVSDEKPYDTEHFKNLAEEDFDEDTLRECASKLYQDYLSDIESAAEWRETIKRGMDLLGVKLEELNEPFVGACSAHHPLMIEAAVQFQGRAIAELYPASGPVKTRIIGTTTRERLGQADRVREFMNYQLTCLMEEYFEEYDRMLFKLPLEGSCFKKVWQDTTLGRAVSKYISADDLIVAYHNTDIRQAGRVTHKFTISANELKKLQKNGFYREIELTAPPAEPDTGVVQDKVDEIQGTSPPVSGSDEHYTLLEMHVDYDFGEDEDEIALPYIVTFEKESLQVLAVRRNWNEDDDLKKRLQWFVHYRFLPGLGFYGFSLVHLLGNLQKSATTILRSLVDAGQFATLPGGFKMRGLKFAGAQGPIKFGEYRDVEGYGDDISKSIMPIPTKEPSLTLFNLLGMLVDSGRRLASISDINVGDTNEENPVGTTLALLEQGVKVMSAIHKRLHKSAYEEFQLLARLNGLYIPKGGYPYDVEGATRTIYKKDFDSKIDVLPVSDPNIFSETQRIMRSQAQLQLAMQFPQVHNLKEAVRRMHEVLGSTKIDELVPPDMGPKPMDPVTENYAFMHGRPVMAYAHQDHEAHLAAHMAFLMDPQLGGNQAMQQMVGPAMRAHIAEHTAHAYRLQVQAAMGMPLPPPPVYDPSNPNKADGYEPLPPQIENEIARRQAMAGQQIARNSQIASQAQQNQQLMQDPMFQIEQAKIAIQKMDAETKRIDSETKRLDVQLKHKEDGTEIAKTQMEMALNQQKIELEREKARMEIEKKQMEMHLKKLEFEMKMRQEAQELQMERAKFGMEMEHQRTSFALDQERKQSEHERAQAEKERMSAAKEDSMKKQSEQGKPPGMVIQVGQGGKVVNPPAPKEEKKKTKKRLTVKRDKDGKLLGAEIEED